MKRHHFIIIASVLVVTLVIAVSFNYPQEDFSVYNTQWNGASDLQSLVRNNHPSDVIFNENGLNGKDPAVVLLLNPDAGSPFSSADLASIRSYVENGGSIVIANDFGNANQLLDGLGIGGVVRFNGSLLYDDYSNWAGAAWPTITTFANSSITTGIGTLSFNYATTLDIGSPVKGTAGGEASPSVGNVTILAKSSPASYLGDYPPTGVPPPNDTRGAKPVVASLIYGEGKIILLSDPSVLINSMIGKGDNEQLFKNIIANLTNGDPQAPVFFDESHRAQKPLLTMAYLQINNDETLKYLTVLAAVGTFAALLTAMRINRSKRKGIDVSQLELTDEAVFSDVAKRHPQWSTTQIRKLLRGTRVGKKKQ